jgi:RTX calcium-binding nonapeptide repeat (4 copies)
LYGTDGVDSLYGDLGNDTLFGGFGIDLMVGTNVEINQSGDGPDIMLAGSDNDVMYGNNGNDSLVGDDGNDLIYGGQANDLIVGGSGADNINGNLGSDILRGGTETDTLTGGVNTAGVPGNDYFVATFGPGNVSQNVDIITDFDDSDRLAILDGGDIAVPPPSTSGGNLIVNFIRSQSGQVSFSQFILIGRANLVNSIGNYIVTSIPPQNLRTDGAQSAEPSVYATMEKNSGGKSMKGVILDGVFYEGASLVDRTKTAAPTGVLPTQADLDNFVESAKNLEQRLKEFSVSAKVSAKPTAPSSFIDLRPGVDVKDFLKNAIAKLEKGESVPGIAKDVTANSLKEALADTISAEKGNQLYQQKQKGLLPVGSIDPFTGDKVLAPGQASATPFGPPAPLDLTASLGLGI